MNGQDWTSCGATLPSLSKDDGREVSAYVLVRVRVDDEDADGVAGPSYGYPAVARLVREGGTTVWVAPEEGEEFNLEDVTHWTLLPDGMPA